MRRFTIGIGLALLGSAPAAADRPVEDELLDIADTWSNRIGASLRDVSFDLIDMRFDVRAQTARVRLGGIGEDVGLRLDSEVHVTGNTARVRTRCDLALGGARLKLTLPPFELSSDSVYGERAVVVRVPIFEGRF